MLMIRPAFRSMKWGAMALQVRKTDLVFTANVRSQSSSVLLVNGMPGGAALPASRMRSSRRTIIDAPEGHMTAHPLRSRNWFGRADLDGFAHRSWLKTEGFSDAVFDGRPVVGIANSWSELTNCNAHLRQVAEAVKRGVWSSGGFPLEF